MPIDFLDQILEPAFIIKPVILVILGLYIFFSFIVFNQIRSLNQIIKAGSASATLQLIALTSLLVAISLFLITLVIL